MTAIVSVLLAVVLALGGAGVTAYAAQDSLPTEPLYSVKLLSEDARLGLTPGPQGDLNLLVGFVAERVREITTLAARGDPVPARVQTRLQEQLNLALRCAAQMGDADLMAALEKIRAMAQNQVRTLEQTRANAPRTSEDALRLAEQVMNQARNTAEGGLEDPLTFRHRQGQNRPDGAPEQPDTSPQQGGPGFGPDDSTRTSTPQQPTGTGPSGPWQGHHGPGGPP